MDGDRVNGTTASNNGEDANVSSPLAYIETLNKGWTLANVYGMTYEQYWDSDVCMFALFDDAYQVKKELEYEENNYRAWLQGLYFMSASNVSTEIMTHAIAAMLSGKKPKKCKSEYPSKPFALNQKKKQPLTEEQQVEQETAAWLAFLSR